MIHDVQNNKSKTNVNGVFTPGTFQSYVMRTIYTYVCGLVLVYVIVFFFF